MTNKLLVGGIFCDSEKASDCVSHHILLSKLKFYGITDKDFQLYQSYLDNRYCRTAIYDSENKNKVSNWARVSHGIPQGSILGPLLFLLYINDLPKVINKTDPIDLDKNTNMVFKTLNKWLKANKLSLKFNKTKYIHIMNKTNKSVNLKIGFNNNFFTICTYTKFLGMTIK